MAKSNKPEPQMFGTFESPEGDRTFAASSIDEAVRLRFNGWQQIGDALPENDPEHMAESDDKS